MPSLPGAAAARLPLPLSSAAARQVGGDTVPVGADRALALSRLAPARQTMEGRMTPPQAPALASGGGAALAHVFARSVLAKN